MKLMLTVLAVSLGIVWDVARNDAAWLTAALGLIV